jgi:negative regulator of flagellin synthesis FlgM
MKINHFGVRAVQSYNNQARPNNTANKATSFADQVEISKAAKDMQTTPTYESERAARVQKLTAEVRSGEYKVNARQVAEDMLKYYRG